MATMDIFNADPFSLMELTGTINRVPYSPRRLASMGLFEVKRLRTPNVTIESMDHKLAIIQTDARGEPITKDTGTQKRKLRSFPTARLADAATIHAGDIEGIREYGTESEFKQVATEVQNRLTGPSGVRSKFELTWEHQRLGAVQGVVLDADGTEIIDWYDEFSLTPPSEIDFDLDAATPGRGVLRKKCNALVRSIAESSEGAWVDDFSGVVGLVGSEFWDELITHTEVREMYLAHQKAMELGGQNFGPYGTFNWGGIDWMEYRGTVSGSVAGGRSVAVGSQKAVFFPRNIPGLFQVAFAPGETFGSLNMPGQDTYTRRVLDPSANGNFNEAMWVRFEMFSYPLFICTRPDLLRKGKMT